MSGIIQGLIASLKSAAAATTDAYFNLVTLLLNTTTTNGAQNNTFLDSSSNTFSITRNGNTTQGTFTPFSQTGWSNNFDSSGSSWLLTPSNAAFNPSGSNVTVDCFVYLRRYANVNNIVFEVGNSSAGDLQCNIINTGTVRFATGGNVGSTITGFQLNAWNYITCVLSNSGTTLTVYLNGVAGTPANLTPNSKTQMYIGAQSGGNYIDGYISNFRFVKGAANVPSGVPTAPLTVVSGTSLLTCQSNRFVDNSGNGYDPTPGSSGVSVQSFSPFAPTAAYSTSVVGGSGYFDGGTSSYLSSTTNTAVTFGNSAYTIQMWVYQTSRNSSGAYLVGGIGTQMIQLNITSTGTVNGNLAGGASYATTTATVPLNAWTHLAFVRTSTAANGFQIYINGVSSATGTDATNYASTNTLNIGTTNNSGTFVFTGYISGLQILNGTAASISVPTTPPTNITNTSLLLNYTNAGIYDAAAKNDLQTVGNAQVSTTQAKFGTTSMSFNGTTDYLKLPSNQSITLNADFTIEGWIYFNSVASNQPIMSFGTAGSISNLLFLFNSTSTIGLRWYYSNGTVDINQGSTSGWSANTWYYIAAVRSGSTLTLYRNGVSIASGTTTQTYQSGSQLNIGGSPGDAIYLNGYIDEFRITKYARTISTPTSAFPVQ